LYTSPELVDGLTLVGSYKPQGTANRESSTGYGINYSGIEGLSVSYADTDVVGATTAADGDNTVLKASYAYGPVTVSYSNMDHDLGASDNSTDIEISSYAVSYTVSENISLTYGAEESSKGSTGTTDAEIDAISASYTAGGMTISASMYDGENLAYGTGANEDIEYWSLSASFAF